jgi:hypothetical protein
VPNLEVRESLMEHLLNAFTNYPVSKMSELGKETIKVQEIQWGITV